MIVRVHHATEESVEVEINEFPDRILARLCVTKDGYTGWRVHLEAPEGKLDRAYTERTEVYGSIPRERAEAANSQEQAEE